jgi:ribosomal protein S18 acetylase RimI-like enzyme
LDENEKLVKLFVEYGFAMLDVSFVTNPNLRCSSEGEVQILKIIDSLKERGYKMLSAPAHLDSRDTEIIRFFKRLGFRKSGVETFFYERNLLTSLPDLDEALESQIKIRNMEDINLDALYDAIKKAFISSVTQMSPLTLDELDSRIKDKDFLKSASLQSFIGDQIVSFVLMSNRAKGKAELAYQGTIPNYQRKGIGFHLLCKSMKVLKKNGFHKIVSEQILPQSKAEISLLEKAGFKLKHSQINMNMQLKS